MALTETKCPNCGANMVVESDKGNATCMYCNTVFAVVQEIKAPMNHHTVDSDTTSESLELLDRAEALLSKFNMYENASELFKEYALSDPFDYRGWWGIARSLSEDFTKRDCDSDTFSLIEENVQRAFKVAGDELENLEAVWNEYKGSAESVYIGIITGKVYTPEDVEKAELDPDNPEDTVEGIEENLMFCKRGLEKSRKLIEEHQHKLDIGVIPIKRAILTNKIGNQTRIINEYESLIYELEPKYIKAKLYDLHYVEN